MRAFGNTLRPLTSKLLYFTLHSCFFISFYVQQPLQMNNREISNWVSNPTAAYTELTRIQYEVILKFRGAHSFQSVMCHQLKLMHRKELPLMYMLYKPIIDIQFQMYIGRYSLFRRKIGFIQRELKSQLALM
jgi:hypothetical protein